VAHQDATGKVIGEYSDTRLIVAFDVDKNADESPIRELCEVQHCLFNVQPSEVRSFRDVPCNIRPADIVYAKCDLGIGPNLLVVAGTRGFVRSCIDEMRITVAFEGCPTHGTSPQMLTVSESSIEKIDTGSHVPGVCRQMVSEEAKEMI